MDNITAKVTGIRFANQATGFAIAMVVPDGGGSPVAVRGTFPGVHLAVGLRVKATGKWEDHPTYGRQFSASHLEVSAEKGRNGVVAYLISNVSSIGPVTAARLYDAFGDELVTILEKEPERVSECAFLTPAQAEAIIAEWKTASENRTVAIFLTDLGLNASQAKSVFTKYGIRTKDLVQADPYCLYECQGVGFSTADVAARKFGVGRDDPRRVRAMVLYSMNELSSGDGHVYTTSEQIQEHVKKLFRKNSMEPFSHGEYLSDSAFYTALSDLVASKAVVSDSDCLYLSHHWKNESRAAECLAKLLSSEPRFRDGLSSFVDEFEVAKNVQLSPEQRQAFMLLEGSRVCVVSGFPGTGKTLLISAFVHLFERLNLHYVLMSPTGIAAKRLSQVTGKQASTIHRALGYKRDGTWEFNSDNKYAVDAVIVDEMSMVDSASFYRLVSSLLPTTILILVGDSAQLPSVGAGYVLQNLMRCDDVPHVSLTRIYRQDKASDIVTVAHSMLRGDPINTSYDPKSEFIFLPFSKEDVLDEICKVTQKMKENGSNFQVIAPMYDGDLGVNNLNRRLREVLNSDFASGKATKLKHGETDLYVGDRVMVVKNDYERAIFNGDVGKVTRISTKDDEVEVKVFDWFDQEGSSSSPKYVDKIFTFKVEEARQVLKVAYACTAHKVQGQEFDFVVMPMTMKYGIMLYRNLVYTSITRAKKKVLIFGDQRAFEYASANDREVSRNSRLAALTSRAVEETSRPAA
jgi:exodeoxyribonuclease V alpha subunit